MALADRAREQISGASGPGPWTLPVSAVPGFQTFLAAWGASGSGKVTLVVGSQWQTGLGTINAGGTQMTLTTPYNGSSGVGVAVNFSAGTMDVFGDMPAYDLKSLPSFGGNFSLINGRINATVGSSALTIAIKTASNTDPSATDPVFVVVRNATLATGDFTVMAITAATSLVISSGSTMGTTANVAFRLWIVGFNDGGTFRLGAVNCWDGNGILPLDPGALVSSTAEGGAGGADSAQVIYTGTAVTSKPFALLGYLTWNSGLGTAGTWSAAPDVVQLFGNGIKRPGDTVQMRKSSSGAVATGTTLVPLDDTIPQNTEGDQYFTVTMTPRSPVNPIRHSAMLMGSYAVASPNVLVVSLFQDSIANALASSWQNTLSNNNAFFAAFSYLALAGTGAATTYKLRAGGVTAGTFTLNGVGGSRFLGGALYSNLTCEELMG